MCNCGCNTCETKGPLLTEGKVKSLLSEGLQYHIDKKIPLFETVYRIGSDKHLSLIKEARKMYSRNIIDLCEEDEALIKTHLGEFALYEGVSIPLDLPMLNEIDEDDEYEIASRNLFDMTWDEVRRQNNQDMVQDVHDEVSKDDEEDWDDDDNIYTLRESNIPSQEEVNKFFSDTQNEMHYLNSKPVAGQKKTFNDSEVEPWDEYDLSNWKSLNRKAKLNEYSDENFDSLEDAIANSEFSMDYDQLGSGEKEWVRDEIDNMSMNEFSLPKFDVVKPIIDKFLGGIEKAGKKLLNLVKREGKQTLALVKEIAEYVIKGEKPNASEQKKITKQLLDLGAIAAFGISGGIPVSAFSIMYWVIQESGMAKEFFKLDEDANKGHKSLNEKEGVPHYTKDGKEWKGKLHKMPDGSLMSGNPHDKNGSGPNGESEKLYHKEDLKEDRKYNQEELLRLDLIARRKFDCDYEKCTDEQKSEVLKDKIKVGVKEALQEAKKEIDEAEFKGKKVALGKPKRGGPKAYYVYVKDGDKVKKVTFGSGGLRAKIKNKEARNAFAARHNCKDKKDRTKAGYWSCNLPRYAPALGLGAKMNTFW